MAKEETIATVITAVSFGGWLAMMSVLSGFSAGTFTPRSQFCDVAVLSVSRGVLSCGDRSWRVVGSRFTPRGEFPVEPIDMREGLSIYGAESITLPFKRFDISETPKDNPQYASAMRDKARGIRQGVFAIHENNLNPGQVSAGCPLVSREDLDEISQVLPGSILRIVD